MSSFEVSLKTEFGTVSLHFQNASELDALLQQLPDVVSRVQRVVRSYVPETVQLVEPGLEHVYANLPGNLTKLFIPVGSEPDTIAFIVYTKYPTRMTIDQITDSAAIAREKVRSYLTNKQYSDRYVGDSKTGYSISLDGLKYVNETIKPKLLRKPAKEEEKTA